MSTVNLRSESCDFILDAADNRRLANVRGQFDEHLRQLERRLGVKINSRGNIFQVVGDPGAANLAQEIIKELYAESASSSLTPDRVHMLLQEARIDTLLNKSENEDNTAQELTVRTRNGMVKGRGPNQKLYLANILSNDINFGVGPAGTGKTYLAVACAVDALEKERVRRIVLTRPAVEAGERLGFLPGDLSQKIDPYLRPLYDALYEMLGFERVAKLMEKNAVEVAPLAYMRGRTLNDSFIILDEAQNTTIEQMKMFLTRIGFGSIAVVTGDITQVDLPRDRQSGLRHVIKVLQGVEGLSFTFFQSKDVVRHPLVQRIINAYEESEEGAQGDIAPASKP